MASFPTSVWAPATRNVGDTIGAAFFNDPDAEIVAIEDGYLNGKAPLNSSNSTLANLSVTGGSTFAGGATFNGSMTFSTLVFAPNQPTCWVFHATTQSIPDQAETAVTFNSEDKDNASIHSTSATPTRLTVPAGSSGTYIVHGRVSFAASAAASNIFRIALKKNASSYVEVVQQVVTGGVGAGPTIAVAGQTFLDGTGYMELYAYQQQIGSTGALNIGSATREFSNQLRMTKIA